MPLALTRFPAGLGLHPVAFPSVANRADANSVSSWRVVPRFLCLLRQLHALPVGSGL